MWGILQQNCWKTCEGGQGKVHKTCVHMILTFSEGNQYCCMSSDILNTHSHESLTPNIGPENQLAEFSLDMSLNQWKMKKKALSWWSLTTMWFQGDHFEVSPRLV